jgi:hypothetical protein
MPVLAARLGQLRIDHASRPINHIAARPAGTRLPVMNLRSAVIGAGLSTPTEAPVLLKPQVPRMLEACRILSRRCPRTVIHVE